MAITSTQQTDILKVVAGLFNAAPGGTNLSDLANAVSGGMTIKQLANVLASNTLFTNGIMAGKVTTDDQAAVLMNNFGLVADNTTTSAGSQALAYFKAQIDAKVSFGDIVFDAVTFLSTTTDATFTTAATLLANKALVAASYSASTSSSDLSVLQNVVKTVTGAAPFTAADVAAALASVGDTVAPTVTAPTAAIEYNENQAAGATLATIAATDNGSVASFQIASGDTSGFFAIDSTGKISLTDAGLKSSANDFETTPNTVTLGITATDGAGNKSTPVNVILNVKDVDDVAPSFTSAVINGTTATISFSEALSTTAATPAIADFAVGIKGGSGSIGVNAVQVTGSTVVLTLGRAPATGETFTVAYTQGTNALQDVAGNKVATFTGKDVVVDTTAPTITASQTFTYVESVSDGKGGLTGPVNDTSDIIGTVAATDNTGITSFAIASGNDKGWFAIDSTGKLTLTTAGLTAASNDFEVTPNSFSLGITAKDGAGNTSAAGTVTVSVTNNTTDDPAVGSTFTLTTSIDNVTSAVQIVNGIIDQTTATNTTWNLSDSIATAAGGTVNLTLLNNAAGSTAGYSTSGVTTLNIKSVDQANTGAANSFDVAGLKGLTKLSVANSTIVGTTADTLTVSNLAAATALDLNTNGQFVNVTASGADWTGAADTLTLTAAGRSGNLTLGTGIETVAITTTDAAARLGALTSQTTATNKTVTVAGEGLKIDAVLDSTITSFDASKSTGPVNVFLAPGSTLTSAKGGTGTADVLAVNALGTTQTISGFEKLIAEATGTYNLTNVTGVTTLGVDALSTGAISFTNAAATTDTINFSGAAQRTTAPAATGNLTFVNNTLGYTLKTATGAADTLKITVDNGGTATTGTATVAAGAITATAVENITVTASDWKATTFTGFTMAGTGTAALNLTAAATASNLTFGAIAMTHGASATTPDVIDFSLVTGTTSSTVSGTGALTFSGGTGVDTVLQTGTIVDTHTQTYNLGAGNDDITIKSALAAAGSVAVFNGDAGDDTFRLDGTTTSVGTFTINGGDGTGDTLIVSGAANTKTLTSTISGIEKINFQVTGAAPTTLALTVAASYADTVLITNVGADVETVNVTSTGSVDLSKWTQLGMGGTDIVSVTGSGTIKGMAAFATSLTGGTAADIFTGGTGIDTYNIAQANSNTTAGVDTISNFVGGTDILNLAVAGTGTVNTGSTNADVSNNSADVATTGATVVTLLANLQTAADALGANLFDQAGDTFAVKITGASFSGTDAIYVVQNTGADTNVTAADTIIALIGTSTGAISVATIV